MRTKLYGPEERRHRGKAYGLFTQCGIRLGDTRAKVTMKSADVTCERCRQIGGDRFVKPAVRA
jgi:hypothetical protein